MRFFVTTRSALTLAFLLIAAAGCATPDFKPGEKSLHYYWPATGFIYQGFYGKEKISGHWPGYYYDEHDELKFFDGLGHMHRAIDIDNFAGTEIRSAGDGIARRYDWDQKADYGNLVMVDHGNKTWTLYAHLRKITVQDGQAVKKGDLLGEMGSTGNSTGPHLHFEIRHDPNHTGLAAPHYVPGSALDLIKQGDIIPYDYPLPK